MSHAVKSEIYDSYSRSNQSFSRENGKNVGVSKDESAAFGADA